MEGVSAASAVDRARDKRHQAVLPMQGKIPNAIRTSSKNLLQHVQIADLLQSVHPQRSIELPLIQSRYQRVLVLADPDVDGMHASLLLVLFFYQHAQELIEQGKLYMLHVPLYGIYSGSKCIARAYSQKQLDQMRIQLDNAGTSYDVTRFKGVGSLNNEMLKDCLAPDNRYRLPLSVSNCREMCAQFS